jgi:hypothetical protein
MPRPYISLALLGALVIDPANAQPPRDVLSGILQNALEKRVKDIAYIKGSKEQMSVKLDTFDIGPPEPYRPGMHNLTMADLSLPVYPVIAQFTVFHSSGRHRMEKDFYCFVTYQRKEWNCAPWTVMERNLD